MINEFKNFPEEKPREFTVEDLQPFWEKIVEAIENAPTLQDSEKFSESQDNLESKYIQGKITKENFLENKQQERPYSVTFPDFDTLRATFYANEILSKFLKKEQIEEFIEHEKSHLEEAEKHGYETIIGIDISKTQKGRLVFQPYITALVDLNVNNEEELRDKLKSIARAPKDLSPSDRKKT